MVKITIDSNILIRGLDGKSNERQTLERFVKLHKAGIWDVAISNRFEQDKAKDKDGARVYRDILIASQFTEISSPFRTEIFQEHGFLVDNSVSKYLSDLFKVDPKANRKNTAWDVDHLYGHLVAERDWFITNESRIWKKRNFLKHVGIYVSQPNHFITAFDEVEKLQIQNPGNIKIQLASAIDILHVVGLDPQFVEEANEILQNYLSAYATESEKIKFEELARNPTSTVGKVIAVISDAISSGTGLHGEAAFIVAMKQYARIEAEYQSKGAVYGDDYLGLIRWIRKIYGQNQ
jgi:hypothetical protein